jgi:hypothetical protein
MTLSEPITITFRGQQAGLQVARGNGFCWGRITTPEGRAFDVNVPRDLYGAPDQVALAALAEYAQDEGCIEPCLMVNA